MSSLNVYESQVKDARPPFLFTNIEPARDVNIDDSAIPKTLDHPWYDVVSGKYAIPAGYVLAQLDTGGLYVPIKRTSIVSGGGAAEDFVVVGDASPFAVGDEVGDGTVKQTVLSIDYDTNTITADAVWGGAGLTGGELFDEDTLPGAETAKGVLTEEKQYGLGGDFAASIYTRATFKEEFMPLAITAQMKTDLTERVVWI